MTKRALLELDSYRLAQYAVQVPCYVCEGGNSFDAELCRHCFAPMALAHQANVQNVKPQMVATIGSSGSGKTVYLGMLMDMLSRRPDRLQLFARGAFSVTLQQLTVSALARSEFPSKTPNEPDRWNWVHCQIKATRRKKSLDLIMPDISGEALMEEIEHPNTFPVIQSFLRKASAAMVLVDARDLTTGTGDQDYFIMKLLTYLSELDTDKKTGWQKRPLAVNLSKADECESCFDDPSGFARKNAQGMWKQVAERFPRHRYFSTGVAGACAYRELPRGARVRIPLRIEPRGIVEPFEWLMDEMK
jgi:hypothetical protein